MVFTAFNIEYKENPWSCPSGLRISEGNGTELMDERCGKELNSVPQPALLSKSNVVKLLFHTGGASKPGWSLAWRAVFASGTVSSSDLDKNSQKEYTVEVKEGLILSIEFNDFEVEFYDLSLDRDMNYQTDDNGDIDYFSPICRYSHLTITDGDGTTLVEKVCGYRELNLDDKHLKLIRSKSNVIKLQHYTNRKQEKSFWSLSWRAVTPGQIFFCF